MTVAKELNLKVSEISEVYESFVVTSKVCSLLSRPTTEVRCLALSQKEGKVPPVSSLCAGVIADSPAALRLLSLPLSTLVC